MNKLESQPRSAPTRVPFFRRRLVESSATPAFPLFPGECETRGHFRKTGKSRGPGARFLQ